jgi:hypothetical protein
MATYGKKPFQLVAPQHQEVAHQDGGGDHDSYHVQRVFAAVFMALREYPEAFVAVRSAVEKLMGPIPDEAPEK